MKEIKILKVNKPIDVIGVLEVFGFVLFEKGKMVFAHNNDNSFSDNGIQDIAKKIYTKLHEMGFCVSATMQRTAPLVVISKKDFLYTSDCNQEFFSYEDSVDIRKLISNSMNGGFHSI